MRKALWRTALPDPEGSRDSKGLKTQQTGSLYAVLVVCSLTFYISPFRGYRFHYFKVEARDYHLKISHGGHGMIKIDQIFNW